MDNKTEIWACGSLIDVKAVQLKLLTIHVLWEKSYPVICVRYSILQLTSVAKFS